jgi:hypothetical protein
MKNKGDNEFILSKMKDIFFEAYMPENDFRKVSCFMTTREVYESFQKIFPSKSYDAEMVATWLFEKDFKLIETRVH